MNEYWESNAKVYETSIPRPRRSISQDPPVAYFFQPEDAYHAADLMERRQIQILVIRN